MGAKAIRGKYIDFQAWYFEKSWQKVPMKTKLKITLQVNF